MPGHFSSFFKSGTGPEDQPLETKEERGLFWIPLQWSIIFLQILSTAFFLHRAYTQPLFNHPELIVEHTIYNSNVSADYDSGIDLRSMMKSISMIDHRTKLHGSRVNTLSFLTEYLFVKAATSIGTNPSRLMQLSLMCLIAFSLFFLFRSICVPFAVSFASAVFFLSIDASFVNITIPYRCKIFLTISLIILLISTLLRLKKRGLRPRAKIGLWACSGLLMLGILTLHEIGMAVGLLFPFMALALSVPQFKKATGWLIYYGLLGLFFYFKAYIANMGYYLGYWHDAGHISFHEQLELAKGLYKDASFIKLFFATTLLFSRYYIFILPPLCLIARIGNTGFINAVVWAAIITAAASIFAVDRYVNKNRIYKQAYGIILVLLSLSFSFIIIYYMHPPLRSIIFEPFEKGIASYNIGRGFYYFSFLPIFSWIILYLIVFQLFEGRGVSRRAQTASIAFIFLITLTQNTTVARASSEWLSDRWPDIPPNLTIVNRVKNVADGIEYSKPIYLSYPQLYNYGIMMPGQERSHAPEKQLFVLYAVFYPYGDNASYKEFYESLVLPMYMLKEFEDQEVIAQAEIFERLKGSKVKAPQTFYDVRRDFTISLKEWKDMLAKYNLLPETPAAYANLSPDILPALSMDENLMGSDRLLLPEGVRGIRWSVDAEEIKRKRFIAGAFIKSLQPGSVQLQVKSGEKVLGSAAQTYIYSYEFLIVECELDPDTDSSEISLEIISNKQNEGFSFIAPFILDRSKQDLISSRYINP